MTSQKYAKRVLPKPIGSRARWLYQIITPGKTNEALHQEFVTEFFPDKATYSAYRDELDSGQQARLIEKSLESFNKVKNIEGVGGGVGVEVITRIYALVREEKPDTVVETGVCNGLTTVALLLALNQNDNGTLYSVDYPFHADEDLDEFRSQTFDGYGGAAIPADKDPGWIIPEPLRDRWELTIGKSQRELPNILALNEPIDLFLHDSEHSHPCMMMEFEMAGEYLEEDGIILADDIEWQMLLMCLCQLGATVTDNYPLVSDGLPKTVPGRFNLFLA